MNIVSRWHANTILWRSEAGTIRDAVDAALQGGAHLGGADLRDADLGSADLRDADLRDADLRDADLGDADLRSADLGRADLRGANLRGANLRGANLRGAHLGDAHLRDAHLRDAKNDLVLPTGETWDEYLRVTLPALLMAGGKSFDSFKDHWQCHTWDNCPMAHAFDGHSLTDVPMLLRPRAEQFVQLYDAHQIPWDAIAPTTPTAATLARGAL